jgi:RNA polymerase sigma factor (sigma-70 family)
LAEFRSTGRQEPFEEIVRRYAAMVFHICFQVLVNRHDAEDATQAVFLTLAVQGKTAKEIRHLGPWLQQVAKRLSLDLKKSRKRRLAREQRHGAATMNGGSAALALDHGLDQQELRHVLSEELNQLAPKYRMPLILHYFGGLSREQMSQELGLKAATLGVRLHRGREMLAARLSQRGMALSVAGLTLLLSHMVREAVTDNMVWTTSHAASQMAVGAPINAGVISARVMSLARGAGSSLMVAKVKGVIAAMLVAGTAVAGGEVVSKVRPLDLKLQGPAGGRLRDLILPKLPDLRSQTPAPKSEDEKPVIAAAPEQKEIVATPRQLIAPIDSPVVLRLPANADWGGSILAGWWMGTSTSTNIPGILWSSDSSGPAWAGGGGLRGQAIGPVNDAIARQQQRQKPASIMMQPRGSSDAEVEFATVPRKPKRTPMRPQSSPDSAPENQRFQLQSAPSNLPTEDPTPILELAGGGGGGEKGPSLALGPSAFDARDQTYVHVITRPNSHSPQNVVSSSTSGWLNFNGDGASSEGWLDSGDWNIVGELNSPRGRWTKNTHHNEPLGPVIRSPMEQWVGSTMNISAGVLQGYGMGEAAAEFDHSGQVIADGYGENRTLDLSRVGVIRNSTSNPPTGHNGWYAQRRGKLVLPDVQLAGGIATWGEDAADPQLDLVNSVRVSVDAETVGAVRMALLAMDRTDYPAMPSSIKLLGVWEIDAVGFVLERVDVAVRYDATLAQTLNLANNLSLWSYDGQWAVADEITIDRTNHLISGSISRPSYFAVGGSIQPITVFNQPTISTSGVPEPAALLAFCAAGLILSRRRRK